MHTLVVGPGALGLMFAAHLQTLSPVTLMGLRRCQNRSQVQRLDGSLIPLDLPQLGPGDSLPPDLDLVVVTTKAGDALEALSGLLPGLPRTVPVLLLQNGMGSQQAIARAFPDHCLLAATTTEGANRPSLELVIHAGSGHTCLGALSATAEPYAETVAERLQQAGFVAHTSDKIEQDLWIKLAMNAAISPFTALLGCPNGALPELDYFRQRITPLCQEIAAVAQADGFTLEAESLEQQIVSICDKTASNVSSMLQDRRAGRPTEINFINGYISRRARAHGVAAPVNQALLEGVLQLH